jgi:hypothetical protein
MWVVPCWSRRVARAACVALSIAVSDGCDGSITAGGDGANTSFDRAADATRAEDMAHGGAGTPAAGDDDDDAMNGAGPGAEADADAPAPATRAARLTHAQWENSVRDLLHLDASFSFADGLRSDPVQSGFLFDDNGATLQVDEALWSGYQRAAADVAAYVTSDAAHLAKLAPAGGSDAERSARLIDELGLRAHRRPLRAEEKSEYAALFAMGPTLYTGMSAFDASARALIEAVLQSPYFVYRIEESSEVAGDRIALDSYEIAARLSYALWNTMPDDALFDAAAGDRLRDPNEVAAQARRMLGDPRAEAVVLDYHAQLFQADRFAKVAPASAFYPNAPVGLGLLAATEHAEFVRDLVFAEDGGYGDMLTSTSTFVNADLAEVYGVSGVSGSSFVKVALDPAQRRGIFTQIGFLAVNATSVDPDPIHRGVFLARRIACMQIAAPPANVPPLPAAQGRTNRETVAAHTEKEGTVCASCHAGTINPLGFPFEHYDAIGAYRTLDNGHPIDSASEPLIGGERTEVADALGLATALAQSRDVHRCYVRHWLEFAYGRPAQPEDDAIIARLGDASLAGALSIEDLVVGLVTSPAFAQRSAEELP